jgi:all-trans-8'-apo-beta-carotenal 15,15'-oxygenase
MIDADVLARPPVATRTLHRPAAVGHDPPWLGGFQDLAREHGFEPLAVEGRLPARLEGTLYRNGPGRFSVGADRVPHWFDGDGALSSVRIAGGSASGAARLVRTTGLEREERAGKRLFGGYGTPLVRPFRELFLQDSKNTANTSVLLWQGRLFATCEAGKPYEVNPDDLSTMGETSLGDTIVGAFSAHSHRVPSRSCTYNFGVSHGPRGTQVDVYELPDRGGPRRIASFRVDGLRLNHDFAATDRYLVFAFAPQTLSLYSVLLGGKAPVGSAKWDAARGTEIVVVPIDGPDRIRRFRVDAFMLEHVVNAFEQGDEIAIDYTHYPDADGLEHFVGGLTSGRVDAPLRAEIRRAFIHPSRDTLRTEVLLPRAVELPRVSPDVEGGRHRYTYCVEFAARAGDAPFGALLKHDLETGRIDAWGPGDRSYAGEGVFVPDPGGKNEDDGWLLSMVYDARSDRSRLAILDARAIGDGPVASCHFDHAIPFGFHGAWAPGR